MSPNVAHFINNTSSRFYSVQQQRVWKSAPKERVVSTLYFTLTDKYDVYVPYVNYQPILSSSSSISQSKDNYIMSFHYSIFYFIAQTGGFIAFFILLIGVKVRSMNERYMMFEIINKNFQKVDEYNKPEILPNQLLGNADVMNIARQNNNQHPGDARGYNTAERNLFMNKNLNESLDEQIYPQEDNRRDKNENQNQAFL